MNPFRAVPGVSITFGVDAKKVAEMPNKKKGDPARVMSRTQLKRFGECPEKWMLTDVYEATKSMDWGSVVDALVICPEHLGEQIAIAPATYPCKPTARDPRSEKPWNFQANHCQDWKADMEAQGKICMTLQQFDAAKEAAKRVYTDPRLEEFIKCSKRQAHVIVEYHDPETNFVIPIQSVLDFVCDPKHKRYGNCLGDLKTSFTVIPRRWRRQVFDLGHYYQAAFHMDAYNAAAGTKYEMFCHLVIESEEPYEIARRVVGPDFMALGRSRVLRDLRFYCQCLKTGDWPGYDDYDPDPSETIIDGWRVVEPEPWMMK